MATSLDPGVADPETHRGPSGDGARPTSAKTPGTQQNRRKLRTLPPSICWGPVRGHVNVSLSDVRWEDSLVNVRGLDTSRPLRFRLSFPGERGKGSVAKIDRRDGLGKASISYVVHTREEELIQWLALPSNRPSARVEYEDTGEEVGVVIGPDLRALTSDRSVVQAYPIAHKSTSTPIGFVDCACSLALEADCEPAQTKASRLLRKAASVHEKRGGGRGSSVDADGLDRRDAFPAAASARSNLLAGNVFRRSATVADHAPAAFSAPFIDGRSLWQLGDSRSRERPTQVAQAYDEILKAIQAVMDENKSRLLEEFRAHDQERQGKLAGESMQTFLEQFLGLQLEPHQQDYFATMLDRDSTGWVFYKDIVAVIRECKAAGQQVLSGEVTLDTRYLMADISRRLSAHQQTVLDSAWGRRDKAGAKQMEYCQMVRMLRELLPDMTDREDRKLMANIHLLDAGHRSAISADSFHSFIQQGYKRFLNMPPEDPAATIQTLRRLNTGDFIGGMPRAGGAEHKLETTAQPFYATANLAKFGGDLLVMMSHVVDSQGFNLAAEFEKLDKDGSGLLDAAAVSQLFHVLSPMPTPTPNQIQYALTMLRLDQDHPGRQIGFMEMMATARQFHAARLAVSRSDGILQRDLDMQNGQGRQRAGRESTSQWVIDMEGSIGNYEDLMAEQRQVADVLTGLAMKLADIHKELELHFRAAMPASVKTLEGQLQYQQVLQVIRQVMPAINPQEERYMMALLRHLNTGDHLIDIEGLREALHTALEAAANFNLHYNEKMTEQQKAVLLHTMTVFDTIWPLVAQLGRENMGWPLIGVFKDKLAD